MTIIDNGGRARHGGDQGQALVTHSELAGARTARSGIAGAGIGGLSRVPLTVDTNLVQLLAHRLAPSLPNLHRLRIGEASPIMKNRRDDRSGEARSK